MFEAAELHRKVGKPLYKSQAAKLRAELLAAQKGLPESGRAVAILVGGVEGAGKAQLVDLFLSWMDARGIQVHAFGEPSDEERERPSFWRYWRCLPPKGRVAILFGSWYSDPIVRRTFKRLGPAEFDRQMDRIVDFERMLADEGVTVVKLWMHLSKKDQRKRLKKLEKDPDTRWRVSELDWTFFKKYDRFRKVSERALLKTSTGASPWNIIEAVDERYRSLAAARLVLAALKGPEPRPPAPPAAKEPPPKAPKPNIISSLDLSRRLSDEGFEAKLEHYQGRLNRLTRRLRESGRSMSLVFEGPDAAGKGGAIRRLTGAMDARSYRVISTAAPNDEERSHPYLWRFWRDLPRAGRVTIYDRSWYGRVLVERLEGFAAPQDWRRAYAEINAFEEQLADFGTIVLKFWIAISPEEELRRFKDREKTPYKQYKITEEDWRNREKWDGYEAAACEMVERTSTAHAPWLLIEGEDKNWARIKILRLVCERLEKELDG